MMRTLTRLWRYFSLGFILAFVIYLLIRWDPEKVLTGVGVAVAGGVVVAVAFEFARVKMRQDDVSQQNR